MIDEDEEEGRVHRIDTVPPPDGESDAYNAPTKVGSSALAMAELMRHGIAPLVEAGPSVGSGRPSPPPDFPTSPPPAKLVTAVAVDTPETAESDTVGRPPRLYDEEPDDRSAPSPDIDRQSVAPQSAAPQSAASQSIAPSTVFDDVAPLLRPAPSFFRRSDLAVMGVILAVVILTIFLLFR